MKISLRATYGILAAVDLALHNGSAPVQAKSIARRQEIPNRFLEQVLLAMRRAGLVTSSRGAQGGYLLGRSPGTMSLVDVLEALDGPLVQTPKREANRGERRGDKQALLLGTVIERLKQAEHQVLSSVTIEDLAAQHRELERQNSLMYHI
jgi:Rrf2 family protein